MKGIKHVISIIRWRRHRRQLWDRRRRQAMLMSGCVE